MNNLSEKPSLLVNEAASLNHWLGLQLIGTKSNRDAVGARVELEGREGSKARVWVQEVRSGSSYDSSSDLRLHFGLGSDAHLQRLLVRWPNGEREAFPVPGIDAMTKLREGSGTPVASNKLGVMRQLQAQQPSTIHYERRDSR